MKEPDPMAFDEDPRMKAGRKSLALAWIFFFCYLVVIMLSSYLFGNEPLVWGLPRWVAVGNIVVPALFVILLIVVAEKGIPDVPLTDDDGEEKKDE